MHLMGNEISRKYFLEIWFYNLCSLLQKHLDIEFLMFFFFFFLNWIFISVFKMSQVNLKFMFDHKFLRFLLAKWCLIGKITKLFQFLKRTTIHGYRNHLWSVYIDLCILKIKQELKNYRTILKNKLCCFWKQ